MTTDLKTRARRYLLESADDAEGAELEREYFSTPDAVAEIEAAEDDLIEDYLAGGLTADERDAFQTHYLASPGHRRRVDTIRRLTIRAVANAPTRPAPGAGISPPRPLPIARRHLALAASLLLAIGAAWVIFGPSRRGSETPHDTRQATASPSASEPGPPAVSTPAAGVPPKVVAFSLSPIAVRGAGASQPLVIPPGTATVALALEGEPGVRMLERAHVSVRTVSGSEIWEGPADTEDPLPPGAIARVNVPANRLQVDDYVVVLAGNDAAGRQQEQYRYSLQVRGR